MELTKRIKWFVLMITIFIIGGLLVTIVYINTTSVTKEKIIKSFNENYSVFSEIQKYISETNGDFIVYKKEGDININANPLYSDFNDCSVKDQINILLNNMKYERISKTNTLGLEHAIIFYRTYGEVEWGIVYLQDNVGEYGAEMVKLRDEWYYFTLAHV